MGSAKCFKTKKPCRYSNWTDFELIHFRKETARLIAREGNDFPNEANSLRSNSASSGKSFPSLVSTEAVLTVSLY